MQHPRQSAGGDGGQAADRQGLLTAAALVAQLVEGAGEAFDGLLYLGQEIEPRLRERHLPRRAGQELDAEILFQLADPVAESRLRQVQMRGRMLEAASLGDGDESMEAQEVDTHAGVSKIGWSNI